MADWMYHKQRNWFTVEDASNELNLDAKEVRQFFRKMMDESLLIKQGSKYLLEKFF